MDRTGSHAAAATRCQDDAANQANRRPTTNGVRKMTSLITSWMTHQKRRKAAVESSPWQDLIDLIHRSIDDPDAIDPDQAADVLDAVEPLLPGKDVQAQFELLQQTMRRRRQDADMLAAAHQHKSQAGHLEQQLDKLNQKWQKVAVPLQAEIRQVQQQLSDALDAESKIISATRSLIDTWSTVASPSQRQAESELQQKLHQVADRMAIVRSQLSASNTGSPAHQLSTYQNDAKKPDRQRHPRDVEITKNAIRRLQSEVDQLHDQLDQLTVEYNRIVQQSDQLRQEKLQP